MASESKIAYFDAIIFIHQNIMGFYISMHDSMPMKVGIDANELIGDFTFVCIRKYCLSAMEKII